MIIVLEHTNIKYDHMPNAGSFHVYSTVRLDNIKLLIFNYLTYRNVNVIYFTNSRSLNNTCICLPHPSPGSSVLFGSWKSRNHTRYFAVVIGGSWDVLHRSSFRKKKKKKKTSLPPLASFWEYCQQTSLSSQHFPESASSAGAALPNVMPIPRANHI